MCKGEPRLHGCGHTSIKWSYCRHSTFDVTSRRTEPCNDTEFGDTRQGRTECPLENCAFRSKGGRWVCCQCRQGPNTGGWCLQPVQRMETGKRSGTREETTATCDHGCCDTCFQSREYRVLRRPGMMLTDLPT